MSYFLGTEGAPIIVFTLRYSYGFMFVYMYVYVIISVIANAGAHVILCKALNRL